MAVAIDCKVGCKDAHADAAISWMPPKFVAHATPSATTAAMTSPTGPASAASTGNLVFVAMPNNIQVGYWMRKLVIDRDFFAHHDERWTETGRIRRILAEARVRFVDEGVLDTPPWPDTVMPANEVLKRLGIRSRKLEEQFTGDGWQWSTMAYFTGEQPDLR